jgi:hypothetical protein
MITMVGPVHDHLGFWDAILEKSLLARPTI